MPQGNEPPSPTGEPIRSLRRRLARPATEAAEAKRVTLLGIVEQGVEGRSVVLLDPEGSPLAQLLGRPAADYRFGDQVRVTGRFVTGLLSGVQQGRPFEVETVEPA